MRVRIALANLAYPESPEESVEGVVAAMGRAAQEGALVPQVGGCFSGVTSLERAATTRIRD